MRMLRSMKTEAPVKLVSFRSQPTCMSVRYRQRGLLPALIISVITSSACHVDADRLDRLQFDGMFPVAIINAEDPEVDAWARHNLSTLLTELGELGLTAPRDRETEAYRLIAFGLPYHSTIRLERQGGEWTLAAKQYMTIEDSVFEGGHRARSESQVLSSADGHLFEAALAQSGFWTTQFPEPQPPPSDVDTVCVDCHSAMCLVEGVRPDRYRIFWRTWTGWEGEHHSEFRALCILIAQLASDEALQIALGTEGAV